MHTPLWSRLVYGVSRGLSSLDLAQQIVRDELFFAFLPPSDRNAITFEAYSRSRPYTAGGEYFQEGLWAWETALLEDPRVPRSGRVLLTAAGGGRELRVLLERGYEVFAFEPVPILLESARAVAQAAKAEVVEASYDDLVTRAEGKSGPLDGLGGQFDLCVLGWGSFSHLTDLDVVVGTLRALRKLAPAAPVLVSFSVRIKGTPEVRGGARKLRHGLRRILVAAGATPPPPGLKFATAYGFFYEYSRDEFAALCARAGYDFDRFNETPHPHALLIPRADLP